MNRDYEFKIGQRVKMWDVDDCEMVYGTVTDKTSQTVFIKWDDLRQPTEHERFEFENIRLVN